MGIKSMRCNYYDVSSTIINYAVTNYSTSRKMELLHVNTVRSFSSITAPASTTVDASTPKLSASTSDNQQQSSNDKDGNKSKKDDSNLFLDNLGKIFLSTIALVLIMLLRSTKSNNARTALREDIESNALLDPLEIDDLRLANSDFTIDVWHNIVKEIRNQFQNRAAVTYPEFLSVVMRVMRETRGEGFTIQFGHLVDRVIIAELERIGMGRGVGDDEEKGREEDLSQTELPLPFLFAALSLALHSTISDRIRALFEVMLLDRSDISPSLEEVSVDEDQVSQMIQNLQYTCQLVPEAQIVETNSKVPYQTYRVGTGDELTKRARQGFGGKKGTSGVTKEVDGPLTLEDFHAILKSRAVCAWGECYVKKRGRMSTSDR